MCFDTKDKIIIDSNNRGETTTPKYIDEYNNKHGLKDEDEFIRFARVPRSFLQNYQNDEVYGKQKADE